MSRYLVIGSIIVTVPALAGCGVIGFVNDFQVGWDSAKNTRNILKLQVGMSRDEVMAIMGRPDKREAYGKTEFLIYRTDFQYGAEKGDFTPIAFVDGRVTGWGRNYYDDALRSRVDANINIKQQ
jgi:hypothetical protein